MAYAAVLTRSAHAAGSDGTRVSASSEGSRREKKVDFPENLTPENEAPSSPPDPGSQPSRSILKKDGVEDKKAERERSAKEDTVVAITPRTLHDIYSSAIDLKSISDFNELLKVAMIELEKNDMEKHYIYAALHSSLRAKAATISPVALNSYANLLTRHAKRDLMSAEPSSNPAHTNAVISILKVVDYLFFTFSTASTIDTGLSNWFLNRGLEALENPETSRSVVGIYLHIFNYQKLPQGITSDMANRLFAIVMKGPKFLSPTIVCEYIAIYRLLLRNAPYMMMGKINEWLPFCFRHLADPNSSVQKQTLSVLQDSSLRFLGRADMAAATRSALSEQVSLPSMDERLFLVDVLCRQISTSLAINTGASTALCIWKTVLLSILQFGSNDRIYNWTHFENFLRLSKLGFNSANEETRIATIHGWKVPIFIYTETPFYQYPVDDMDTSISVVLHPFKLFETPSISSKVQNALLSSYYALLFTSLKAVPNLHLNNNQLTVVWEKVVGPVIQMMFRGNDSTIDAAVSIVSHLFSVGSHSSPVKGNNNNNTNKTTPRILNDSPILLDEIPSFPPRWVRSNVMKVLLLLNSIFKSGRNDKFVAMWSACLGSIRHVAQRDIRVSTETIDSIAGVGNFVRDCLKQELIDYDLVGRLIEETINSFGTNLLTNGTIEVCPETSIVFSKKGGASTKPGAISMDPMTYFFRIAIKYGSGPNSQKLLFTILNLFREKLPQSTTKYLRVLNVLNGIFETLTPDDYRAWKCVAYGIRQSMPQSIHFQDYQPILQWLLLRSNPSGIEISGDEWAEFMKALCEHLMADTTVDVTELIYSILNVCNRDELGVNAKYYLCQGLIHILSAAKAENKASPLKLMEHSEERAAVRIWSTLAEKTTAEVSTGLLSATARFVGTADERSSALYILLDKLLAVVLPTVMDSPSEGADEEYFKAFCELFENALLRVSEREKKEKLDAPIARVVNVHSKMFVSAFKSENQHLVSGFVQIWNKFCRHKKGNTAYAQELIDIVSEMQDNEYDVVTPKSFGRKRSTSSRATPVKARGRKVVADSNPRSPQKEGSSTPIRARDNVIPDSTSLEQRANLSTPLTRSQAKKLRSGVPFEEVVGEQGQTSEKATRRRSSRKSRSETPISEKAKDKDTEEKQHFVEGGDTLQDAPGSDTPKDALIIEDSEKGDQQQTLKKDILVIEDSQASVPSLIPNDPQTGPQTPEIRFSENAATEGVSTEEPNDEVVPAPEPEESEAILPEDGRGQLPPPLPLQDPEPEPELPADGAYADVVEEEAESYDDAATFPVVDEMDNNYQHPLEVEDDEATQPVEIAMDYHAAESIDQQVPEISDGQMADAPEPEAIQSNQEEGPLVDSPEQVADAPEADNREDPALAGSQKQRIDEQLDNDDPFISDSDQPLSQQLKRASGEKLRVQTPSPHHQATDSDDCNLIKGSGGSKARSAPPKSRLLSAQSDEIEGPRLWNSPRSHGSEGRAGILGKYIGSFISSFRGQNERGEEIPAERSGNAVVSIKEFNQINENADYGDGFKRKRKRHSSSKSEKTKKRSKNTKKSDIEEEAAIFKDDDTSFNVLLTLLEKFDQDSDYVKQLNPERRKQYQDILFKRFSGLYNP